MAKPKQRLDLLLVDKGFYPSRQKAQAAILAGEVLVNDVPITKAGTLIDPDENIRIKESSPYVSRGAWKLLHALETFKLSPKDQVAIDIGASTGGFTQVLLEKGAKLVYAIDSGTNQLDWKLRSDPRVICRENTNARYLKPEDFDPKPSFATIDVSFISITKILPALIKVLEPDFTIICLIKPQFEVGSAYVGAKGFVEPKHHHLAWESVLACASELSLHNTDIIPSPITGQKSGNQEYLVAFFSQPTRRNP
ncbi:TlyA family RNA methyltransferase [Thermospira aquatica]|uniref:TlyA family RNA methyltransferase n=1 Tax=Thermospira aquatica TaxID=2828656 RepID=A0AAX3BD00_9SPIR|nr:TlyA family RNA methyltransferase [Thermospira aquatica]URA10050.1 TlyA family RNA methyltransferase [Thermospira aquatica]